MAGSAPLTLLRGLAVDLDRLEAAAARAASACSRARERAAGESRRAGRAERAVSLLREERQAVRVTLRRMAGDSPGKDEG